MKIIIFFIASIFFIKIFWNIGIPYVLYKLSKENKYPSISFMPHIEIILLAVAIGLSIVSDGNSWLNHPLIIAGWGCGIIITSYIISIAISMLVGWVVSRNKI